MGERPSSLIVAKPSSAFLLGKGRKSEQEGRNRGSTLQRELVQTGKGLGGVINKAGARENSSGAGSKEEEVLGGCLD